MAKRLNARQRAFVREYLSTRKAAEAAIAAGYASQYAQQHASRLLRNEAVIEAIEEQERLALERIGVNAERVVNEIARIAFADMKRFSEWTERGVVVKPSDQLDSTETAAISEITETSSGVKLKFHPKLPALELLSKILGLQNESLAITHEMAAPPELKIEFTDRPSQTTETENTT